MNRSQRRQTASQSKRRRHHRGTGPSAAATNALLAGLRAHQAGDFNKATAYYHKALGHEPANPEALHLLGVVANLKGNPERAIDLIRRAIAIDGGKGDYYINLGCAYERLGRLDAAIAAGREAVALSPTDANARYNLGLFFQKSDALADAEEQYRMALHIHPRDPEALGNLGVVLAALGRGAEAIQQYRAALALAPEHAATRQNLAHALLLRGEFQEGWSEYEWRWRNPDFPSEKRNFDQPPWDGAALNGRTILLYAEQGFGDAIQFVRFAPAVAARGGRVLVECKEPLAALFETCAGIERVLLKDQDLPAFDVQASFMSLPHLLGVDLHMIPADIPYLATPESRKQDVPIGVGKKMKIGLVWAGSPDHGNDRHRSCPLQAFTPLFNIEGLKFFSLQTGDRANELGDVSAVSNIEDLGCRLRDFADTAAILERLDLVISVDTATAHLAGALARPVWILLADPPDWRWMNEGTESPWYPSARLLRQNTPGDWHGVVAMLGSALKKLVKDHAVS